MRVEQFQSCAAVWLVLQFGSSYAVQQMAEHPRVWLPTDTQDKGTVQSCSAIYVRSKISQMGGRAIRCADTPYAAVLLPEGKSSPCGATIISPTAILSIAQCNTSKGMVLAGNSQYVNDVDFDPPTQFRLTRRCIIKDDFMVCVVDEAFQRSLYVNKIEILQTIVEHDLTCLITGFGLSDQSHQQCLVGRTILQHIPYYWQCDGSGEYPLREDVMFCTSDTESQAVCPGDLGAGAICRIRGKLQLAAVATEVLYHMNEPHVCAAGIHGNVYAPIYRYVPWIERTAKDLYQPLAEEPVPSWLPHRSADIENPRRYFVQARAGCARLEVSQLDVMLSLLFLALKDLVLSDVSWILKTCSVSQV